jgi:hypothetical protein
MFDWLLGSDNSMKEQADKVSKAAYDSANFKKEKKGDETAKRIMAEMEAANQGRQNKISEKRQAESLSKLNKELDKQSAPSDTLDQEAFNRLMDDRMHQRMLEDQRMQQQLRMGIDAQSGMQNQDISQVFNRYSGQPQQTSQAQLTPHGEQLKNQIVSQRMSMGVDASAAQQQADQEFQKMQFSGEGHKLGYFGSSNATPNGWLSNGRLI